MTTEPNVIGTIPKNAREIVRVALTEFNGYDLIDVRVYAPGKEGADPVPTKAGIAMKISLLPDLIELLQDAEKAARRDGLL